MDRLVKSGKRVKLNFMVALWGVMACLPAPADTLPLITAGGAHTCALVKGNSYCWGANSMGQLGTGNNRLKTLPTLIGSHIKSLVAGDQHTCALFDNLDLKCWGLNRSAQLGLGSSKMFVGMLPAETVESIPAVVLGAEKEIKQVAVGTSHTCVLLKNGKVKCWGSNLHGELGIGKADFFIGKDPAQMGDKLETVNLGTGATATELALGDGFSCALLSTGLVKCWGRAAANGSGTTLDLGNKPEQMGEQLKPLAFKDNFKVRSLSASALHVCAVSENGGIRCWGKNTSGVLGIGKPDNEIIGNKTGDIESLNDIDLGSNRVESVSCGFAHCCAVLENQAGKCWGENKLGQLGIEDQRNRGLKTTDFGDELPYVNLGPFSSILKFTTGAIHTCALLKTGEVKCWGQSSYGQLGNGGFGNLGAEPGSMGAELPALVFP